MDYYLYQRDQLVQKFHTEAEGIAGIENLYKDWKMNAPRNPELKLCYNGFNSVTLKEYPAS